VLSNFANEQNIKREFEEWVGATISLSSPCLSPLPISTEDPNIQLHTINGCIGLLRTGQVDPMEAISLDERIGPAGINRIRFVAFLCDGANLEQIIMAADAWLGFDRPVWVLLPDLKRLPEWADDFLPIQLAPRQCYFPVDGIWRAQHQMIDRIRECFNDPALCADMPKPHLVAVADPERAATMLLCPGLAGHPPASCPNKTLRRVR